MNVVNAGVTYHRLRCVAPAPATAAMAATLNEAAGGLARMSRIAARAPIATARTLPTLLSCCISAAGLITSSAAGARPADVLQIEQEADRCGRGAGSAEPNAVRERRGGRLRRSVLRSSGVLGPEHRAHASEQRAEHHQSRQTDGLTQIGVAEPDPDHRQRQRHRNLPEAEACGEQCRADAEPGDRRDRENRDACQKAAEEHRHSDRRTQHDDGESAPARRHQTHDRARQNAYRQRQSPRPVAQDHHRSGQRIDSAQCRVRPIPHQSRRPSGTRTRGRRHRSLIGARLILRRRSHRACPRHIPR
jgi:hypothetical protein